MTAKKDDLHVAASQIEGIEMSDPAAGATGGGDYTPSPRRKLNRKGKKLFERAKEHLSADETPLVTVLGAYETEILGNDSVRNGVFIATDQRLVFYAKKLTGYDFESFPYENISSVEMGKNLMGHHISFFASGNKAKMKWISAGDVAGFVAAVKERMGPKKEARAAPAAPAEDPLAQLEKLGKLRDAGVVSESEFEAKKADLLSRL